MALETLEFKFPHEEEKKVEAEPEKLEIEIEADSEEAPGEKAEKKKKKKDKKEAVDVEVVDDTPARDRNRRPMKSAPEEVTEEELAEYSDKVQNRLKHFSRGYHDERRAKEAALREKEEAIRVAQKIVEDNKLMTERLRKLEEEEIKREKLTAQYRLKQAHENGDSEKLAVANEELAKAVMREASFTLKTKQDADNEALQAARQVVASQSQTAPVQVDTRATQWQEENSWFGSDDEMTSFALGLHQKLIKNGVDPRSDEYYDRINRRMREVFPDQFDDVDDYVEQKPKSEDKPKKSTVVASASRSTAPRKVVLTKSQVAIAKRLGVPLELYAQKVAEEMRK